MLIPNQDLERRRPVWETLSELFLDTELQERDYRWIATSLAASGYSYSEIQAILWDEVYPAMAINLRSPAGVWAGVAIDWLQDKILSQEHKEIPTDHPDCARIVKQEWQTLLRFLPESWTSCGNSLVF
jgi:hypothetical protein